MFLDFENTNHTWSVSIDKKSGRASVKTSIENQTVFLWRFIIEHEKEEIDYWGTTIDHINNNPLDNRLSNLRVYNAMLNWLIYNAPMDYVNLLRYGNIREYLDNVTDYHPLDT